MLCVIDKERNILQSFEVDCPFKQKYRNDYGYNYNDVAIWYPTMYSVVLCNGEIFV